MLQTLVDRIVAKVRQHKSAASAMGDEVGNDFMRSGGFSSLGVYPKASGDVLLNGNVSSFTITTSGTFQQFLGRNPRRIGFLVGWPIASNVTVELAIAGMTGNPIAFQFNSDFLSINWHEFGPFIAWDWHIRDSLGVGQPMTVWEAFR